jgi:hypothetical protein
MRRLSTRRSFPMVKLVILYGFPKDPQAFED